MKKPLTAALIGASFATQAALAGDSLADSGRYQLIPKVSVPSEAGTSREQPVLLDTETGRTWRLATQPQGTKARGLQWVPLDIDFPSRLEAELASAKANEKRRGSDSSRKNYAPNTLLEEYDDDP